MNEEIFYPIGRHNYLPETRQAKYPKAGNFSRHTSSVAFTDCHYQLRADRLTIFLYLQQFPPVGDACKDNLHRTEGKKRKHCPVLMTYIEPDHPPALLHYRFPNCGLFFHRISAFSFSLVWKMSAL
jgi:hypothetical protein